MFKFVVSIFVLVIFFFISLIIRDNRNAPAPKKINGEVSALKQIEKPPSKPDFLKIKGLPDSQHFNDMNAGESHSSDLKRKLRYYQTVLKNPVQYAELVGDERIYDLSLAKLIYQYHCYQFFRYYDSVHDMKADFLGAFLREYHKMPQSAIDLLAFRADLYI